MKQVSLLLSIKMACIDWTCITSHGMLCIRIEGGKSGRKGGCQIGNLILNGDDCT